MNSGQMTSISTASTRRLVLPFWVYIGKTTRCCRPSTRCCCGWKATSESQEVRHAEAAVGPAAEVLDQGLEVVGVVSQLRRDGLDAGDETADMGGRGGVVGGLGDGPVGGLQLTQVGDGRLQPEPRVGRDERVGDGDVDTAAAARRDEAHGVVHELGERLLTGRRRRVGGQRQHDDAAVGLAQVGAGTPRGRSHRQPSGGEHRTGRVLQLERARRTQDVEVDPCEQVLPDLRVALDADGGAGAAGGCFRARRHTDDGARQLARGRAEDDHAAAAVQCVTHGGGIGGIGGIGGRGVDDEDVGRLGGGGHAAAPGQRVGQTRPVGDDGHEGKQTHEEASCTEILRHWCPADEESTGWGHHNAN